MAQPEQLLFNFSQEDAQKIVSKHLANHNVSKVTELKNASYSYTAGSKTYVLDLDIPRSTDGGSSSKGCCFLTIPTLPVDSKDDYHPNSLSVIQDVLNKIRSNTKIPIPKPILDTSLEIIPFQYLISPASPISSADIISLRQAREQNIFTPMQQVLIDIQIGQLLGQLHTCVQNDWYGLPRIDEPSEPSYSWQETFTYLLETLLARFESASYDLPYQDIKRYLSRAIAFFLFDDVEVPSLIWLTGSDDDIYILRPLPLTTPTIAAILPNVAHAVWGDPLAEVLFMPPAPSEALLEGYIAAGGSALTPFPRQKTKRVWYTLFTALIVLAEQRLSSPPVKDGNPGFEKGAWAEQCITQCVALLRDGPCY